jgi:hypothetical protein
MRMKPGHGRLFLAPSVSFVVFLSLLSIPRSSRAASPRDPVIESLSISLDIERRQAAEDAEEFDRATGRLTGAEANLSAAVSALARLVRESNPDRTALDNAEEAVVDAEGRVRAEQARRTALASRLAEHGHRMLALRDEIARRRITGTVADPLTGRWDVIVNPGPRRGVYRLVLDGTIVSGDYTLDGGFHGSLRGTLVGDKVALQRIDSERGFDANFYGRLTTNPRRIVGTWEATAIAPSPQGAGTWVANPGRDEDNP